MRQFLLFILKIYQKYISALSVGGCRYYPSCSEYAKIHFQNNSLLSAFYYSFTRILRCNQLFAGGIEYPVLKKITLRPQNLRVDSIKYWLVPNGKGHYFIIRNFSFKGSLC